MFEKLQDISLTKKILLAMVVSNLIGAGVLISIETATNIQKSKKDLDLFRQESEKAITMELKHLVETAVAIMEDQQGKAIRGEIPLEAAKANAFSVIKNIRYDDGRGYFWINDLTLPLPTMIMHPISTGLDGKVLDKPVFNCAMGKGQNLFQAMVEVSAATGEGVVDYIWPDPKNTEQTLPKLSYVKRFSPWGLLVGTGVYIDEIDALIAEKSMLMQKDNRDRIVLFILLSLASLVLILVAIWFLVRQLGHRLDRVGSLLSEVGSGRGDLSVRIRDPYKDEVGQIAIAFDRFADTLSSMVRTIAGGVQGLKESSAGLSERSVVVAASTEEMSAQAAMVSQNAQEANSHIQEISGRVQKLSHGTKTVSSAVQEMTQTIRSIADHCAQESKLASDANLESSHVGEAIAQLEQAAEKINSVVDTINDIAEQTNLLALNATIEAATAGEAGKGFAVVANEVKELARQTSQATQEIQSQITEVQRRTRDTQQVVIQITSMINELNSVSLSIVNAVEKQSNTMQDVAGHVSGNSAAAGEIAELVLQSAQNLDRISQNIKGVSEVAVKTVQDMDGIRRASVQVNDLSQKIGNQIGEFKIE